MISRFSLTLTAFAVLIPAIASAGDSAPARMPDSERVRVVILVQNARQAATVLMTSIELLEGKGLAADSVTVVFCGDAVTTLVAPSAVDELLSSAQRRGVRLVACGISLAQKELNRDQLSPNINVVDNGLIEVLRLQRSGYLSIVL